MKWFIAWGLFKLICPFGCFLIPSMYWEFKLQCRPRAAYSNEFSGVTFILPTSPKAVANLLNTSLYTIHIFFSFSDTEIVDLQRSLCGAIILIRYLAQTLSLSSFLIATIKIQVLEAGALRAAMDSTHFLTWIFAPGSFLSWRSLLAFSFQLCNFKRRFQTFHLALKVITALLRYNSHII